MEKIIKNKKKILVTRAHGFIRSVLVSKLIKKIKLTKKNYYKPRYIRLLYLKKECQDFF